MPASWCPIAADRPNRLSTRRVVEEEHGPVRSSNGVRFGFYRVVREFYRTVCGFCRVVEELYRVVREFCGVVFRFYGVV